jgi:hypothetical protein
VDVRVTDKVTGVLTGSLPKLKLVVLKVSIGLTGLVPVPLRLTMLVAPLEELLEIAMLPLAAPATVGSKLTWRPTDWPEFSFTGNVAPDIVNPVPASVAELTISAAVPDEVKVRVWVEVVFSVTLPKARAVALTVNCGVAAAVPVPLRLTMLMLPPEELLEIVMLPLAAPATVGSKLTCSVTE